MKKKSQMIFEDLIKELEETVNKLENGNISLNESIELYKNAMTLSAQCNELLESAKQKIEIIENENYDENYADDLKTEN